MLNNVDRPAQSQNGQEADRPAMLNPVKPTKTVDRVSIPMNGDTKYIEVDYDELRAKVPLRVGGIYPDLASQAADAIRRIEETKNEITNGVTEFYHRMGIDGVFPFLDAVWSDLYRQAGEMEEADHINAKELSHIADDLFNAAEMVKILLHCFRSKEYLTIAGKDLEYATKGILV